MAGTLTVSTLNNDTGVLATQNGMTGIPKAWVLYNGVAQTITGSFNVSSVTYNSTGNYTVNFTTAMPNANYAVAGTVEGGGGNNSLTIWASAGIGNSATLKTTTQLQVLASGGTAVNATNTSVIVFSS